MASTRGAEARARAFRRAAARFQGTFGERLRGLRHAAGLSQSEAAVTCSITQRTLSRYETNRTMPPVPMLLRLAAGIGVELDELVGVRAGVGGAL